MKALERQLFAVREKRNAAPDERQRVIRGRIAELKARIAKAKAIIALQDQAAQCDARIAELENMQAELGQSKANVELLICDAERFVAARCGLLEDSINGHFPTIRWKLFDTQINGALVDCCECMIPGDGALVSYSGTNTAASVNADIEIISVLSRHYDVVAPVFVDNAERINYIVKPTGQLITLSVSSDPVLRIEQTKKEAA